MRGDNERGDIGVLYLQILQLHERNSSTNPPIIAMADIPNIR
jgi:hypothetical protein